jgi:hypothetical protein
VLAFALSCELFCEDVVDDNRFADHARFSQACFELSAGVIVGGNDKDYTGKASEVFFEG